MKQFDWILDAWGLAERPNASAFQTNARSKYDSEPN
jgi:hypothetical protein